jgi:hypothetical protein
MGNKRDVLEGDHSFKMWFKIMWKNGYIFAFCVAIALLIMTTTTLEWPERWVCLIPIAMIVVIGYKGFYQFWNDLKNGTSR